MWPRLAEDHHRSGGPWFGGHTLQTIWQKVGHGNLLVRQSCGAGLPVCLSSFGRSLRPVGLGQ